MRGGGFQGGKCASEAQIDAYKGGRKTANVRHHVPKVTLNPNKFGVASERIALLMDVLFGKITAAEARDKILAPREQGGITGRRPC